MYTGSVSTDGANWDTVGVRTVVSGMVPSKIALLANNSGVDAAHIPADFDYFRLDDETLHVYLPLLARW